MKIVTEADLRAQLVGVKVNCKYQISSDTFMTPLALEYLQDHGVELIWEGRTGQSQKKSACFSGAEFARTFEDAETGRILDKKPERMTHLQGDRLVPKSNKQIAFRGRLDSLQSDIIFWQVVVKAQGQPALAADLEELLSLARRILGAEVCGRPLGEFTLWGMTADELRYITHHVEEHFGFPHSLPSCENGILAAGLNQLRTRVRETELAGEQAFLDTKQRDDILKALNRMSSAVYFLYCRYLAGEYERSGGLGAGRG